MRLSLLGLARVADQSNLTDVWFSPHFSGLQGILLDEAAGVNKNQQPILPAGLQPPETIISSWNRKVRPLSSVCWVPYTPVPWSSGTTDFPGGLSS